MVRDSLISSILLVVFFWSIAIERLHPRFNTHRDPLDWLVGIAALLLGLGPFWVVLMHITTLY